MAFVLLFLALAIAGSIVRKPAAPRAILAGPPPAWSWRMFAGWMMIVVGVGGMLLIVVGIVSLGMMI